MQELLLTPPKYVQKGWGSELWIVNKNYCGKILTFKKNHRLSWHYHNVKEEVFWLSFGLILLKYGWDDDIEKANQTLLNPGSHFEIPVGLRHQMIALEESVLIEFSTHHEDEDSVRLIKGD